MSRLEQLCDQVVDLVGDRAEAQVTAWHSRAGLTRFANSAIHQHVGEDTVSVMVKVASGGRVASSATTRVDDEGLTGLVERALAAADVRPVDPDWPGLAPAQAVPAVEHADDDTAAASPEQRAAVVRAFVDAGPGLRGAGYCDTDVAAVAFANSLGHRATTRWTRATVDGIHQTGTSAGGGHQTSYRLADLDGATVGAVAAELARDSADPVDLDPGSYEVVLAPEAVGTIALFLGFYGFNAKPFLEGQSFVRLGEQQFDAALTIRDDALDPEAIGAPFDAEGTAKQPVMLVDGGVSRALVHDRRTARRAGTSSTGHAVTGGEAWGAFPSNLFVAPGDGGHLDDLVSRVERGVLVTTFNYVRILDPKTQVTTGLTRNGTFLIEDGKATAALSNLRFTESFVDALGPGRVLDVGSAARFADAEFGAGMVVCPPLRLTSWSFTGGARG